MNNKRSFSSLFWTKNIEIPHNIVVTSEQYVEHLLKKKTFHYSGLLSKVVDFPICIADSVNSFADSKCRQNHVKMHVWYFTSIESFCSYKNFQCNLLSLVVYCCGIYSSEVTKPMSSFSNKHPRVKSSIWLTS